MIGPTRTSQKLAWLAATVALCACGDAGADRATDAGSDTGVDAVTTDTGDDTTAGDAADAAPAATWTAPAGPHILGDRPASSSRFWAAPWPDRDRGDAALPNPRNTALVTALIALEGPDAGVSSAVFFAASEAIDPASLPASVEASVAADSPVYVEQIGPAGERSRLPARVGVLDDGGVHAPAHALVVQPMQGYPWPASATIEVVVSTAVRTVDGASLEPSGWSPDRALGNDVAAVARLDTAEPTADFAAVVADVRAGERLAPAWIAPLTLAETFDRFCVFEGTVELTQFQQGQPPFSTEGGNWQFDSAGQIVDGPRVTSRVWVTWPIAPAGDSVGLVQFVRVGGGGDRPLIDRGVRDADGNAAPGSGLANTFADAGYAGLQFDGPHGGARNPTNGDEQFLMFNITNPVALRDNIRQTALEAAVLGDWLRGQIGERTCGAAPAVAVDPARYALFGHSMGATVAPIAATAIADLDALLLSGAGGSWIENVLHKRRPLATRPIAETMLGYPIGSLTRWDPVLNLLQSVGEAADPQVFAPALAARADLDVLMLQGIADTYILPPIANALSLALNLTMGGPAIEATEPESAELESFDAAWLGEAPHVDLPFVPEAEQRVAIVVQHHEDGVEDGHEVAFQLGEARRQIRCLLAERRVVEAAPETTPCR